MKPCLLLLWLALSASHAIAATDAEIEALIDRLPQTADYGFGYSTQFSGSQFLPGSGTEEVGVLILGAEAPKKSTTLETLVRMGVAAVPALSQHLDDRRVTKIPPAKAIAWMDYADEFDFNRRVQAHGPEGVNLNHDLPADALEGHVITVGDLCFVALGQIANRNFRATRYQPTGGLIVSSPTRSKRLCAVTRAYFEDYSAASHRASLIRDFTTPDDESRRVGAYQRLAFYYPETIEDLVLKQLSVPTYDAIAVEKFARNELYPAATPHARQALFDEFLQKRGKASRDGLHIQLAEDANLQLADEQKRLNPPLKAQNLKLDARSPLAQFYGVTLGAKELPRPYIDTWEEAEKARFIEALTLDKSQKIDAEIHEIFRHIQDNDYLAIACMRRLIGKQYDDELRAYCQRRKGQGNYDKELNEFLRQ